MKSRLCWSSALLCGLLSLLPGVPALAQTVWTYQPTNAFPSLTFLNPVCITAPPGETNRLFVVEKHGRIVVITNLAAPTRTIFMDLSDQVSVLSTSETVDLNGEQGLLGLAFHPGYATNRLFYIFYTGQATNGTSGLHDILARFQTTATNANVCLTNSQIRYFAQYDEASNHNGGEMHFGPDGYLYVALGDEGGSNGTLGNTQRIDRDYFSAIMRVDVNNLPGNLPPNPHVSLNSLTNYSIPSDNPWVGATSFNGLTVTSTNVRTEFWAVGMRNPWRFSFDPANGNCYLGHVGQGSNEWINVLFNGANCGWNWFEGTTQRSNSLPAGFTYNCPPLFQYSHTNSPITGTKRLAIIGGVVCRDSRWPDLNGAYLYCDYNTGEFWALRHTGTNVTQNLLLFTDPTAKTSCFGVDPSNNDGLYAALRAGNNSIIQRIISTNTMPVFTSIKLSGTNLVFTGTNGARNGNFYLLTSTNLTLPTTNWFRAVTNPFDASGNFNFTSPPGNASNLFYRLQVQ